MCLWVINNVAQTEYGALAEEMIWPEVTNILGEWGNFLVFEFEYLRLFLKVII